VRARERAPALCTRARCRARFLCRLGCGLCVDWGQRGLGTRGGGKKEGRGWVLDVHGWLGRAG